MKDEVENLSELIVVHDFEIVCFYARGALCTSTISPYLCTCLLFSQDADKKIGSERLGYRQEDIGIDSVITYATHRTPNQIEKS